MTATVPYEEIVDITGGLKQHRRQLDALHARGFHRAYLGTNGKVVLERPHYEAICRGIASESAPEETKRPRLRQAPASAP